MTRLTLLTACVLIFIQRAQAEDWPQFRGPTGQGHSTASHLPVTWSETQNIAWKVAIPGSGWSSPVVADERVYLTTAVPVDEVLELRVLCLDASSGATMWDVKAFDQLGGDTIEKHAKNSHASPTPVIEGDRLYVHFGPHGTACLRTDDGEMRWRNHEIEYAPNHGNGSSPVLAGDKLIIACDGRDVQFVLGLDKGTGEIVWRTERDATPEKGFSFCTPFVIDIDGRRQAVCPASGAVFSYDPQTGEEIWRVTYGEGFSVVPRPVYGNGLLYVCTGFGDGRLLAIDPSGTGDITDSHVKWTMKRGVPRSSSLLLVGEHLFAADDVGIATCVNAITGDTHWQERLGGNFSASPLYAAGSVYFQNETGTATVVRASTTFEELSKNSLSGDERTFASFAVHNNAIILRSEGHLYRIEDDAQAGD